jgi:hypothetical protein
MFRDTYKLSLPLDKISKSLGIQLTRAKVTVHTDLWAKTKKIHPESFHSAELHLNHAITTPDYIGQAPHHFENIEFIKRTPAGPLLVAIKIRDKQGNEIRPLVTSTYLISASKLVTQYYAQSRKGTTRVPLEVFRKLPIFISWGSQSSLIT